MIARYRFVLTNRPYLFLLSSSVISEAGDWAARLALTWLMYTLTGSVLASAAVLVVSVVPAALIGPWLAAATASWSHRRATILCDVARAGFFAAVAIRPSPVLALGVAGVAGVVSVVFESHRSAWLPHVTGTDSLGTAVSLAHALSDATVIIGYAAGGILLGVLGVSGALWVNAATFLASGLLLTGVGRARSVEDGDERPVGLLAAWAALSADRWLLGIVALATVSVAAATSIEAVALPVLTSAGIPVGATGVVLALGAGVSLAITLMLPGQWTHQRAGRWIGALTVVAFAGAVVGLAVGHPLAAAWAVVITGLAYVALVPANVLVTTTIPAHLRTSTFSLLTAALATLQALMVALAGAAVDRGGITGLVWFCAAVATLGVLLATLNLRLAPQRTTIPLHDSAPS
ncbi:MAG: hypothetical protein H6524_12420 [Actinobacteria bacterium]|nr:hypothetical protein [Actinomycetota bacterium]HRV66972.1 hypothetical protein [Candidatus Nanopelagicales bacterium]MCB9429605.1 hypothetical protein [Actinomycetota bacterium]HPE13049.1 hypothetical protein [Actinomycetota bacterium]HPJ18802.1 hypothetical protein [Actinomycetota bacterium]